MKKLVADRSEQFHIESRATSTEELGNPVYPPARRKLSEHGISCNGKYAQRITRKDYESFDYVICMDGRNLRNILYVIGEDDEGKLSRLMDYTDTPGDVADPWYSNKFDVAYRDKPVRCPPKLARKVIEKSCRHRTASHSSGCFPTESAV